MEHQKVSPQDLVGQELLNDAEKFGETVKHLRMAAKWNQDELADRIGVTRQTISSIENGSARASKTIGIALSAVFKEYQSSVESNDMFNIISESTGFSRASTGLIAGALCWTLAGPIVTLLGSTAIATIRNLTKDKK